MQHAHKHSTMASAQEAWDTWQCGHGAAGNFGLHFTNQSMVSRHLVCDMFAIGRKRIPTLADVPLTSIYYLSFYFCYIF